MNGLLFETVRSCVAGNSFECCISFGLRGAIGLLALFAGKSALFVLARLHRSMSASILILPVIKGHNGAPLRPRFGKNFCLDVTLKAVVLKTPGQTNSGALCLLQDFLGGASLRRRGAPWWRILTKRAAIAAMRPHCAVFCHRSIAADCCPARFADEFRCRAFSASPASQSVR